MLYCDRIDISKGIDPARCKNSKESMVFQYWVFNHEFKFQDSFCNGCQDLTVLCLNIREFTIITVKDVDYHCFTHDISKSDAIHLFENYVLNDRGYT